MYPCKLCIVRACCSSWCDEVISNEGALAVHIISTNRCPDCGEKLIRRPHRYEDKMNDDPMYFCIPCTKVFIHSDPGAQPKMDVSHISPMTLEEVRVKASKPLRIMRFGFGHSKNVIDSTNGIIEERLREKNPKLDPPDPREEAIPVVMGNQPIVIHKTKMTQKTRIYGQNAFVPRVWTVDDDLRSKTNGDFLINESGHWVKYYESQCNESSYNGIYCP